MCPSSIAFNESPVFIPGYYRFPTVSGNQIVFVSEDDLWTVPTSGGLARRLSSGLGKTRWPALSHDGRWIAFSSTEEGHAEVFIMPADGGSAIRLTYLGSDTRVIGWTREGRVLFASNHEQGFSRLTDIYTVDLATQNIAKVPCGPATHADFDARGRLIIARHGGTDLAYWKRYRGGTAGEVWIDRKGVGAFAKLLKLPTNTARPLWAGNRIVFISDHEGIGNVYSVLDDGSDVRRHSDCNEYYARGLSVHGTRFVFHSAGDIFFGDVQRSEKPAKVEIEYRSPRTQLNRRFVSAMRLVEDYELHPSGDKAVISARGKTFSFDLWKGPVLMHGEQGALRYRLGRFLNDGNRVVVVSDAGGEEALEIHDVSGRAPAVRLTGLDLGRTVDMKLSPNADEAALTNHRNELVWVDLKNHTSRVLDRSVYDSIFGFNWSPDGQWIAYSCSESPRTNALRICNVKTGAVHKVTEAVLHDVQPVFDPMGEYLYFLSYREFDPVYDSLHFDLGFPRGCRPYLLTLRKGVLSPFSADHPGRTSEREKNKDANAPSDTIDKSIRIDFDGIESRIVVFPLPDGRYGQIEATREKIYFTRLTIKGSLRNDWLNSEPSSDAQLEMFDLESERAEILVSNISNFRLSQDCKFLIYRAGHSIRVIKAGEKPGRDSDDYRRGGWLDLDRVQVPIQPGPEWQQMFREAWRLQRDHFWREDMSKVDWNRVYDRYRPLLERVGARSEVSDLILEMQGELGTSHAYEIGGDYRHGPHYGVGHLGIEVEFSEGDRGYVVRRVMKGDPWDEACSSPLARAGLGLEAGDLLVAIDGHALTRELRPSKSLVHRAGQEVVVTFRRKGADRTESVSVKTLRSEQLLRYREWVNQNRLFVHARSAGRVGYLHIPNMGPFGYAEFYRAFLGELDRDGLIVDVRFNGGGHVSQLLLEKLARRRIGYTKSRWFGVSPYPLEAPAGPMVALTNEYAGSDGDIFSHSFKLLKLGPLIGKRTWGGVIGISPRHNLVDGGVTTQPEYSYWFQDVGWRVENYGTDPDIEVEFLPSDYVKGLDPQLAKGLEVCLERLKKHPPARPDFRDFPDLSLPESTP